MGDSHKSGWAVILAAFLAVSGILEGCAGPSTRVLPRETREQPVQVEELPVLEEGNPFYLREELEILADSPRPAGSEGEKRAVRYIRQFRLKKRSGSFWRIMDMRFLCRDIHTGRTEEMRRFPAPMSLQSVRLPRLMEIF